MRTGTSSPSANFDVYGAVRGLIGQSGTKHRFGGRLGHPSDDEIGLTYMRARHYDTQLGRFLSEDPASHGVNWYIYCLDNPVNAFDYTGRETLAELEEAEGGAVSLSGGSSIGVRELEGQLLRSDKSLKIFIDWVESTGKGQLDHKALIKIINEFAKSRGRSSVTLMGEVGEEGSMGFQFFENCLNALGGAGKLTDNSPLAQLYWLIQ